MIVVDLQKGIVGLPQAHPVPDVLGRTADLLAEFRRRSLPTVLVNGTGGPAGRTDLGASFPAVPAKWSQLARELGAVQGDHLVTVTDGDAAAHDHSITKIFPRIAETGVAKDVLAATS